MTGTSGRTCTDLSGSPNLQLCLESRLKAKLDVNGSPEYSLTWKHWDLPSGRRISALRASGRRTGDNGCTGWPSPNAIPETRGGLQQNPDKAMERTVQGHQLNLDDAVCLTGWVSPSSRDWKDTPGMATEAVNPDGSHRSRTDQLPRQAALVPHDATLTGWSSPRGNKRGFPDSHGSQETPLAPWITPQSHDYIERGNTMADHHHAPHDLSNQAGLTSSPSPASTESRGALNPAFSRWLMGYPPGWDGCADTATQSCLRLRQLSSARTSKRKPKA